MSSIQFVKKNIDKTLILGTLAKILFQDPTSLNEDENLVLQALRRVNPELENQSLFEIKEYLSEFDEDQLLGLANNVKGVLHEIQFVKIENENEDEFIAALFTDTNHPDTDVILTNNDTGETFFVQLKATHNESYVESWIENHPDGEILVTEEIADKMGLESTEISNEGLTVEVSEFTKKIIELEENDSLWDYIPTLSAISIAIAGFFLFMEYKKNNISYKTFKSKFIKLTGIKLAKFTLIAALMMIPIVNIAAGTGLLYNLLYNSGRFIQKSIK